jgi:hypothetical protein
MKRRCTAHSLIGLLALSALAYAAQAQAVSYVRMTTMVPPAGYASNDISWVDAANARYYLSAAKSAATSAVTFPARVLVFDTEKNQLVNTIVGTGANAVFGPAGAVALPREHEVWIGDGDSTVKVINTDTNAITHVISTGGTARADELAYDPVDHLILIANDRDNPAFVTFISQRTYSVVKKLNYDGTQAPLQTGGLEQPVWDGKDQMFYLAVPKTSANPSGEVDEIDPKAMVVTRSIPTTCNPAGLVLVPPQRLMTSCGDVLDIATGKVVTTVSGVSGDEIWYNPGDERVYYSSGAVVNVVDANTYNLASTFTVGKAASGSSPAQSTHSLAVDSATNRVYVAVGNLGMEVWVDAIQTFISADPTVAPVTGTVFGSTNLNWNAPGAQNVEIHVNSPNGPLLTYAGNSGSATASGWVTDGTVFYLQDVSGGKPRTAANTLATCVAHVLQM